MEKAVLGKGRSLHKGTSWQDPWSINKTLTMSVPIPKTKKNNYTSVIVFLLLLNMLQLKSTVIVLGGGEE